MTREAVLEIRARLDRGIVTRNALNFMLGGNAQEIYCPACDGRGRLAPYTRDDTCPLCYGTGEVLTSAATEWNRQLDQPKERAVWEHSRAGEGESDPALLHGRRTWGVLAERKSAKVHLRGFGESRESDSISEWRYESWEGAA